MSDGKILIHHLTQSRSERIFWLLEVSCARPRCGASGALALSNAVPAKYTGLQLTEQELGLPYDVKVYARTKEGKGPKSLAEAVTMGKVGVTLSYPVPQSCSPKQIS